jgi:hypothetical protein
VSLPRTVIPQRIPALIMFLVMSCSQRHRGEEGASPWAIAGNWELNLARTQYGPSADSRRNEQFSCEASTTGLACHIDGERANGGHVAGRFTVQESGVAAPVCGVPEIDTVRLYAVSESITDATFSFRGSPAFGYRAYRSGDGGTLTVVSVDPASRAVLTTIVSYDRR